MEVLQNGTHLNILVPVTVLLSNSSSVQVLELLFRSTETIH